ncbi:MAG: alpha/beta hydrolase [Geminicoccaceae bacterium]
MATILLVHGSWHGGWVWDEIGASLSAMGHEVLAPSLRGLGEDAANLDPTIGLWTHVDDLERLIVDQAPGDLFLVGHSYGSAVVHGLEGRVSAHLRAVVHLEGAIPALGSSIMDSWPGWYRKDVLDLAKAHDGWRVPPPDPGIWTGLDETRRAWLRQRLRPQSLKTYQDVMPVDISSFPGTHYYLWAKDRPTQPYRAVVERFQDAPNWTVVKTTGGHELPLSNPGAVMRMIEAALSGEKLPSDI